MSADSVSIPKYCHHKGSNQAFVLLSGKHHYLGRYGSPQSKEAYSRLIAEFAIKRTAAPSRSDKFSDITVNELSAAYLDFAESYYVKNGRMTSQVGYVKYALREMKELYGRRPISDFGPLALRAIQQRLVVERKFYRKTVNSIVEQVKRVFKWGASLEMLPDDIYRALTTVPGLRGGRTEAKESVLILPVDEKVVEATLPYLPPVVADMVRFQRLTGCRPGEACQLRPMDLDRSAEVWQYRPGSHKTQHHGRERIIFIGPKAQLVLLPYLARDPAAHCFCPAESEVTRKIDMRAKRKTKVQPSQRSRKLPGYVRKFRDCYTNDGYAKAIRRAVTNANKAIAKDAEEFQIDNPVLLANWAPNQLRHSCATEVRREYGLEAAQVVLGHSKADVTQVYAERDHALAAEVMKKIG